MKDNSVSEKFKELAYDYFNALENSYSNEYVEERLYDLISYENEEAAINNLDEIKNELANRILEINELKSSLQEYLSIQSIKNKFERSNVNF